MSQEASSKQNTLLLVHGPNINESYARLIQENARVATLSEIIAAQITQNYPELEKVRAVSESIRIYGQSNDKMLLVRKPDWTDSGLRKTIAGACAHPNARHEIRPSLWNDALDKEKYTRLEEKTVFQMDWPKETIRIECAAWGETPLTQFIFQDRAYELGYAMADLGVKSVPLSWTASERGYPFIKATLVAHYKHWHKDKLENLDKFEKVLVGVKN
jgi:hypothetical protein